MNGTPTTRFGRTRFGGGTTTLVLSSLGFGAIVAAILGAAVGGIASFESWVPVFVVFVSALPALAMVGWAVFVDYGSLKVQAHPEASIEVSWLQRAAAGAFGDLLLLIALATAPVAFLDPQIPPTLLIGCVPIAGLVCLGIRYVLLSRKER